MKKITRDVFVAADGCEFGSEAEAVQHEIIIALQDSDSGIYVETWRAQRIAEALYAKFNITALIPEVTTA